MHDSSPRWLDSPRVFWFSLLVALGVSLPTLGMGFALDDYIHLLLFEGKWPLGSQWDLFRFAGGEAEGMRRLMQEGPYPWWTLPELKIARKSAGTAAGWPPERRCPCCPWPPPCP